MRKYFKTYACACSIIATLLMLLGIILSLLQVPLFHVKPHVLYFSAINFILFAILFHLAGKDPEKKD